jgi:hypothetical protein
VLLFITPPLPPILLDLITTIKSRIRWVEQVAHMGGKRNVYKVLVRKHEGKITCKILGIDGG